MFTSTWILTFTGTDRNVQSINGRLRYRTGYNIWIHFTAAFNTQIGQAACCFAVQVGQRYLQAGYQLPASYASSARDNFLCATISERAFSPGENTFHRFASYTCCISSVSSREMDIPELDDVRARDHRHHQRRRQIAQGSNWLAIMPSLILQVLSVLIPMSGSPFWHTQHPWRCKCCTYRNAFVACYYVWACGNGYYPATCDTKFALISCFGFLFSHVFSNGNTALLPRIS